MRINNDVNFLNPSFKVKFDLWWAEVKKKYPNAHVFEALRSQERQDWLYASWRTRPWPIVTRTKKSKHLEGKAVDIVFYQGNVLTWNWPYDDLIEIAKKYEIHNLKPIETCHFEDNGKPLKTKDDQLIEQLVKDWIYSGELGTLDQRMLTIVARVYDKTKLKKK